MPVFDKNMADKVSDTLMVPQAVTASIELAINKVLALNTNSISFASLSQKTMMLELAELPFLLCFTVSGVNVQTSASQTVIIVSTEAESPDCVIESSFKTLNKLKDNHSLTELIKQDELNVSGDLKIAQQFANIAQSLEIDWQSELASHIGDMPTHKLLQFGKKISNAIVDKSKQLESDINEYLVHEKRLVVTNSQIKSFNQQTKDIANKVDDLSDKIDKLINTYNKNHNF